MTPWRRLLLAYQLALIDHYLTVYPTIGQTARALGMDSSDFRRLRRRLEGQRQAAQSQSAGPGAP